MTLEELIDWCSNEYELHGGCSCAAILPDGADEVLKHVLPKAEYNKLDDYCFVLNVDSLPRLIKYLEKAR